MAFVADLTAGARTTVVATGSPRCCRLDHRGARGAEPNTGDGAGIMIQMPDAFLRAVVDFPLPPAGAVRDRPGLPARPTPPTRPGPRRWWRSTPWSRGPRCSAGGTCRPTRAASARPRWPAMPRIRQLFLAARRLTDRRPARPARRCPASSWTGWRSACASRPSGRPPSGACGVLPVAVRPHHRLQGDAHPRPAAGVLPGPDRRADRQRDRAGALPVLHQHVPVLAAGPPVPVHRPQR